MCCTYSIICWSNIKRFLSIFNCFWKVFCFEKFQKIQKFYNSIFGYSLVGHASRKAPVMSLLRISRDSLASESPSHKKQFKIFGFWSFSRLIFATWSRVEALVMSLHRRFRDSLVGGSLSRKKDLDKIFKILFKGFWQLILETCSWVNWVVKIACFVQIGLNLGQFSKTFQFSLTSRAHTLSVRLSLS